MASANAIALTPPMMARHHGNELDRRFSGVDEDHEVVLDQTRIVEKRGQDLVVAAGDQGREKRAVGASRHGDLLSEAHGGHLDRSTSVRPGDGRAPASLGVWATAISADPGQRSQEIHGLRVAQSREARQLFPDRLGSQMLRGSTRPIPRSESCRMDSEAHRASGNRRGCHHGRVP